MEGDQPATKAPDGRRGPRHLASSTRLRRPRPQRSAEPLPPIIPVDDTTVLRRVRSGVVLAVLLAILGVIAAVAVGVLVVAFITTLKQAVG